MTRAVVAVYTGMKKLLVGSQAFAGIAFVFSQAQSDPVGAAAIALLSAVAVNLILGVALSGRLSSKAGAQGNDSFSLDKLGAFLEGNFAVARLSVLAATLFASFFAGGLTQSALQALFIAGAAAQTLVIVADNADKGRALLGALFPAPSPAPAK